MNPKPLVLLFVLLLLSAIGRADTAYPKWEYAQLVQSFRGSSSPYSWVAGDAEYQNVDASFLVGRLRRSTKVSQDTYLFDVIGAQGWELVSAANAGGDVVYVFKRLKPSDR